MHRTIVILLLILLSLGSAHPSPLPPDRTLSLTLEGVPLIDVLNMIAMQNGLNLVVSGDVEGTVSLRLNNVDIATALDATLMASGYDYFVKDNVIVVKQAGEGGSEELVSNIITLNYLDPVTAKKAVESRLSERGKVVILDKAAEQGGDSGPYRANRILITDLPSNVDQLVSLVTQIDVAERLVLIEAKIIESKVDDDSKLGLLWPSSFGAQMTGVGSGTETSTTSLTDNSDNAAAYDPNSGAWTWGKLSIQQVNLVLDLLDRSGNSRLISDPKITTIENHEAEIKINTVIPIQTINRFSEGAVIQDIVTFQDEEVGISLKVRPRINGDGKITLQVSPKVEDIIGYSGSSDNQKPITAERSITTQITVENGETVALGGLFKEDEITVEQKVPLLGHIPLLGKLLFTNKSVEKSTTDLIILITPTILD